MSEPPCPVESCSFGVVYKNPITIDAPAVGTPWSKSSSSGANIIGVGICFRNTNVFCTRHRVSVIRVYSVAPVKHERQLMALIRTVSPNSGIESEDLHYTIQVCIG